jgi:hypothetical protein
MVKFVFALWFAGVVSGLGSDNYKEREAATKRADNWVFAMTHRPIYDNMECNRRIHKINDKYSGRQLEIQCFFLYPEVFWEVYLIPGYNRAFSDLTVANYMIYEGWSEKGLMARFCTRYCPELITPNDAMIYYAGFTSVEQMRDICNQYNPRFWYGCRAIGIPYDVSLATPVHP